MRGRHAAAKADESPSQPMAITAERRFMGELYFMRPNLHRPRRCNRSPCEGATDHRWKTSLTMMVIQAPCECERHREHNDRGDDQTADEQNTLSSTIHRRIPISMPAILISLDSPFPGLRNENGSLWSSTTPERNRFERAVEN